MTDKELALAVPTAFPELFPDQWEHDHISNPDGSWGCIKDHCSKCKKCGRRDDEGSPTSDYLHEWYETSCTVPTPIDINDYNVAMKVRDALVEQGKRHALKDAMKAVHAESSGLGYSAADTYSVYFAIYATPADYLRAALEAVKGVE